jgi:hypothetical protein
MGYVPDLHKIWVGTSDQQLMALSNEFPGFYRYAPIMEEASEAERNKASRPYDGMAGFSEEHKQRAAQLLVTAANVELYLNRRMQSFTALKSWTGNVFTAFNS